MKLNKCLDKYYLDFLAYLQRMEINGFKIYDLFNAIRGEEVDIADCYKVLAKTYSILEKSLGDPQLALYKLSELISSSRVARFLREYGNTLFTSGDTRSFVTATLRSEFASLKVKISEMLKLIEVLHEAMLVAILCVSVLSILPLWPLPMVMGVFVLQLIGLIGSIIAVYITQQMLYTLKAPKIVLEVAFILASSFLVISVRYGLVAHLLLFSILYVVVARSIKYVSAVETESLKILSEVYSQVMLGESVDIALLNVLKKSRVLEFRLIWRGLLSGFRGIEILHKLKLPVLSHKIMSGLTTLIHYSSTSSTYVASIAQFVDEVNGLRKHVEEKVKYYLLYTGVIAMLLTASYFMILKMPAVIATNVYVLGVYGYVGTISTAAPACLLKDRGFVGSKTAIPVMIMATAILLLLYISVA